VPDHRDAHVSKRLPIALADNFRQKHQKQRERPALYRSWPYSALVAIESGGDINLSGFL
jgi:hypothetical protein